MTAQIVKLQLTIDQMITELHKSFATEREAGNRADRARIRCGQLLLALRVRIEAGEAGDVRWWSWYKANIARSRRDANKVMQLARAADPEAALETERAEARDRMARHRERVGANCSPHSDADPIVTTETVATHMSDSDADPSGDDPVEQALDLVEAMTINQRQRFFAALRSKYAYSNQAH